MNRIVCLASPPSILNTVKGLKTIGHEPYRLYGNKPRLNGNPAKCRNCLKWRILSIGETVNWGHRGASAHCTKK